jgi:hypothetical protein
VVCRGREANEPPACCVTPAWYRDNETPRHRGNSENRIRAGQSRVAAIAGGGNSRSSPPRRLGHTATRVVWSIGCFPGEWRNGRRAGFRCQCPSGRGGSSPPSPTGSGSTNCRRKGHELERARDLCVWVGGRNSAANCKRVGISPHRSPISGCTPGFGFGWGEPPRTSCSGGRGPAPDECCDVTSDVGSAGLNGDRSCRRERSRRTAKQHCAATPPPRRTWWYRHRRTPGGASGT